MHYLVLLKQQQKVFYRLKFGHKFLPITPCEHRQAVVSVFVSENQSQYDRKQLLCVCVCLPQ